MKHYTNSKKCPYCGGNTRIISSKDEVPFKLHPFLVNQNILICENYPNCESYSFFNSVKEQYPGIVADKFLRKLRNNTHNYIDILWKTKMLQRIEMYRKLCKHIHLDENYCHVRYFGIDECVDAIMFAVTYICENISAIKTYTQLNDEQCEIIKKIIKTENEYSLLSSEGLTGKKVKTVFNFMPEIDDAKIMNVNCKRNTCSILRNNELIVFNVSGNSICEYIKSISNGLYNVWKQNVIN